MNDCRTLGPTLQRASWPGAPEGRTGVRRRLSSLAILPTLIATWRERIRLRRELEEKARDTPHLIKDMGLETWQIEAEIAKPFWQP
ncbi:DUF1127 domain-containing protein [Labrys neptuniae]